MEIYVAIIAFLIFLIIVFVRHYHHKNKVAPMKTKISQIRSQGDALVVNTEQDLTEADLMILRKQRNVIIFVFFISIVCLAGGSVFLIQIADIPNGVMWQVIVFFLLSFGIGFYGLYYVKRHDKLIMIGRKTVLRGIVTDKRIENSEDTESYELEIDRFIIPVEKKLFNKYEIGDIVEIHVFKSLNDMILSDNKLGRI